LALDAAARGLGVAMTDMTLAEESILPISTDRKRPHYN
jgi:hypothetical protein